jgi:hypothetical protein
MSGPRQEPLFTAIAAAAGASSGAPMVAWATFEKARFEWTAGEPALKRILEARAARFLAAAAAAR